MWNHFVNMAEMVKIHWIIMGDLNVIGAEWEKQGGILTSAQNIGELQHFLVSVPLVDIGFVGNTFTWMNKRFDGVLVKERLDRVLANFEWLRSFSSASLFHEFFRGSDHSSIILDFADEVKRRRKAPFCYEASWAFQDGCVDVISDAWVQ